MKGNCLMVAEELVRVVGAIVKCPACHGYDIRVEDREPKAYARATNAWKDGSFGRMEREEVIRLVTSELDAAPLSCSSCSSA